MASEQSHNADTIPGKGALSTAQRLLLEKRLRGLDARKEPRIERRPAGVAIPLSAEQKRIWLHALQQPDLSVYNEPITIYRYGSFQLDIFSNSFNEIIRRHEAWRTYFTADGKAVVQDVLHVSLPFLDVSALAQPLREMEVLRVATEDAERPLRLDKLPLFHARIVRMSTDEHRLYLTLHHIIFDGVSLSRVLLPELAAIYAAFERGETSPLGDPTLQYGDYAFWRERELDTPGVKQRLQQWTQTLSGELPVLRLPTDRPRPAMPSHRGLMHRFDISQGLKETINQFCRHHGVTMYMTLLAAFEILLFRYGNQNDLIIGSPVDGRRRPELEHVMGYFLDTIAIRTRPHAQMTVVDYVMQTRNSVLEAFAAADVPFDRVVHEVNPRRDSSHHPIFQAFFSMRPVASHMPLGWDLGHIDISAGAVKFDLYLELGEQPDYLEGRFLYSTDIFDVETIQRMETHLLIILQALCETPEAPIGYLPMLSAEEHTQLLGINDWNNTAQEFPQIPLYILIEEQAGRTPHAVAVVFNDRKVSYRELIARSNVIAKALIASGVERGSIVVIALERSVDLLAGLLAVLKLRAAYLPIDILMPPERIALCLADASPVAILTQASLLPQMSTSLYPVLLVETITQMIDTNEATAFYLKPVGDDALDDSAYVIYTSGTTGAPKAVDISQRNLVNLLFSMKKSPGFQSTDILLALTSISFDIAALELFLPLICGGTVVIASREEVRDPQLLRQAIERSKCTVIQATPSTWRALLLSGWNDARRRSRDNSIATLQILCGGEALTGELADHLLSIGGELWNMYGPTETTIWSMIHRVPTPTRSRTGTVSVGRPIANTQAYVLDAERQLLPVGVSGELFLGGTGVAKGYRGQLQQTLERFVSVASVRGARLYRTGDLAVRKADGTVDVLGRIDNQVKVRGYRVELEAVEAAILQHPQVSSAAARVWPEAAGDMRLSAYVVGNGTMPPSLADMRTFLASSLPDYMIPSDLISIYEMPLTSNGKTDRSRLPKPEPRAISPLSHASLSTSEARIADIWSSVLGQEHVALDDNFFSLGGHSILVAALQQKVFAQFGLQVPMAELFHLPTVRQQAGLVDRLKESKPILPPGVFALQTKGSGEPVFWVHYANESLAKAMGTDQPFFSVVLTVEDMISLGDKPTLRTIAMFHMQKILAVKPNGPYRIGGFCVGGVLAYEVAILFQKAGYDVSRLILVDAPNPTPDPLKKIFRYIGWIAGSGGMRAVTYSLDRLLDARFRRANKRVPAKTEMRTAQEMIEGAASQYKPGPYTGKVVLVQASDRLHMDLLPAWRDVIREGLETEYVDGHHDDLMKAYNVQDVGAVIRTYLSKP